MGNTTRAVPDGDGFRLNGTKTFSSNGPIARRGTRLRGHRREKRLPRRSDGVSRGEGHTRILERAEIRKLGLRTCPIGELVVEDVRVPASALLGGVGGGSTIFTQSMDWERACFGACHVGTMQRILEEAIEHSRTRSQYGQVIGK